MKTPFLQLEPPVRGECDVCERHTTLTVLDQLTSLRVGKCCFAALKYTHDQIDLACRVGNGPRHPYPGEISTAENQ